MKSTNITIILFLITTFQLAGQNERLSLIGSAIPVFTSGQDGYVCYRIPAIIQLNNTDLLAFAEGRKKGCSDTGDIDLVMKRSSDQGMTWGQLEVIWNDRENTCGNPAPIVNQKNGDIILLSTWNLGSDKEPQIIDQLSADTRRIFLLRSSDHGRSWTKPKEITKHVKEENWTWYATGPGSGIQLRQGANAGRMIVGCDHIEAGTKKYYSHAIYSDNGGRSWKLGGSSPLDQVNECEVAELTTGQLIMNMRNYDRSKKNRQTMKSDDGGLSWTGQRHDEILIEPICQASLLSIDQYLFFSNPASQEKRKSMTVRLSTDEGKSWSESLLLHDGPAAYSDLTSLDRQKIGCLFEAGTESAYEQIIFQRILLK